MNFILVHIVEGKDGNKYKNYMSFIESDGPENAMLSAISHLEFCSIIGRDDSYIWYPNNDEPILKVSHTKGETIYKIVPVFNISPYTPYPR